MFRLNINLRNLPFFTELKHTDDSLGAHLRVGPSVAGLQDWCVLGHQNRGHGDNSPDALQALHCTSEGTARQELGDCGALEAKGGRVPTSSASHHGSQEPGDESKALG